MMLITNFATFYRNMRIEKMKIELPNRQNIGFIQNKFFIGIVGRADSARLKSVRKIGAGAIYQI